ncbi:MAG: hypothetical protein COA78_27860 [Blastopirellula sp.]|nr:MAG: hypothetical protein COA78_27860 [Blastopirellula sp.]
MAACFRGKKIRIFRVTELITTLLEARDDRLLLKLRAQLSKQHLLILDELGYVPASKAGAELLFDIIGAAYERQSLIITTNLAVEIGLKFSAVNDSRERRWIASLTVVTSSKRLAKATESKTPRTDVKERLANNKLDKPGEAC